MLSASVALIVPTTVPLGLVLEMLKTASLTSKIILLLKGINNSEFFINN
ncbi:hypothetical protein [Microcystis aeruginosa]|nr:hypothetical protein [Microcystis aeruginosa]